MNTTGMDQSSDNDGKHKRKITVVGWNGAGDVNESKDK